MVQNYTIYQIIRKINIQITNSRVKKIVSHSPVFLKNTLKNNKAGDQTKIFMP